ncbi:negative regulator of flagellin synthesis FlgM [Massilia sp. UYP11]|uniref:flagellar biosynthesis anti-sigma factor FlgM n=1 Tax=Massilia sp. UYP11 TaxID=1756385 RepID=UPI003D1CF214
MKITGSSNGAVASVASSAQTVAAPVQVAQFQPDSSAAPAAALQSEVLKPAAEALRAMPDFDAARVAELRDALARGELPFDPGRLAGLIQKFHGGR